MAAFTALAIGGLALSAFSQVRASRAQRQAGEQAQEASESQAELQEANAAIADVQAKDAIARGAVEESKFRMGVRGLIGSQRVAFASGNIDAGFGSAVDVQADAAYLGEIDALTIRSNAAREAWGYRVAGDDLRQRADIARREGANAAAAGRSMQTAGLIGAGQSLLGGAGSLLAARYGFHSPTLTGNITREF